MAEMRAELVGLLIEKHGERAKIKLDKDKSKGEKIPKYLEAWCPINAKVGDVVGVEYQEMNKRKMQMILYGFPVLSVIAGAVFGNSIAVFFDIDKTMPVMLGVVIWLLVSVNYARIFKRDAVREGVQPVVIEIEAPDPIVFDDTEDENEKKIFSDEWEGREEWFWQNRRISSEQTSDDALEDFFIWYWQIRLLQEK